MAFSFHEFLKFKRSADYLQDENCWTKEIEGKSAVRCAIFINLTQFNSSFQVADMIWKSSGKILKWLRFIIFTPLTFWKSLVQSNLGHLYYCLYLEIEEKTALFIFVYYSNWELRKNFCVKNT